VLGPDHPATATGLSDPAELLKAQGDYVATYPFRNLAAILHAQWVYAEARPLFERALAIREKVLGPDHPDTRTTQAALADIDQHLRADQT